jgi:tRNA (uracil-5-)-methyltransferase TRM9
MQADIIEKLLDINRRFYQTFGGAFAATRRRLQPGIQRLLPDLLQSASLVDVGCGSGEVARALGAKDYAGRYLGVDFSAALLDEARSGWDASTVTGFMPQFALAELTAADWCGGLAGSTWVVGVCFAVLHHIPDRAVRDGFVRQLCGLLQPGGLCHVSVWQFQHNPRLVARQRSWSEVGLDEGSLEPGDTLLDWRYTLPGQPPANGLRYVHLFTPQELGQLAAQNGFEVRSTFESDGAGGRQGLYQTWEKIN